MRVLSGGAGAYALDSWARSRTAGQQAAERKFDDCRQEKQDQDGTKAGEGIEESHRDEAETFIVGLVSRAPRVQKDSCHDQEETRSARPKGDREV